MRWSVATEDGIWVQPTVIGEQFVQTRSGSDAEMISDPVMDHAHECSGRPRIAVLIPAYNEGLTIGSVVLQARKHADMVLVVNDGSKDRTSEIARGAGAKVIDRWENGGKASALRAGFDELKRHDLDIVVMMDGDGQHDVGDISALIAPLLEDEADLVIGSRFLNPDNLIPLYRQVGQQVLNIMTNIGLSEKITDTQSGLRAFNRKTLLNMDFMSEGYAVEQDMLLHCSDKGLRIAEVPISVRYDVPNGHKQGSLSMGIRLFRSIISTLGYKRPLLVFGVPGSVLFSFGLIIGLLTFLDTFVMGAWALQGLATVFMITTGAALMIYAILLNSLSSMARVKDSMM